jgi:hypothetical protein
VAREHWGQEREEAPRAVAEHRTEGRDRVRGDVDRAVGLAQAWSDNRDVVVLAQICDQRVGGRRRDDAVRVHEQHDVARTAREPLVDGSWEAEVLLVRDQLDLREALAHDLRGPAVVDDDDVQIRLEERVEARADRARRVVGDDDGVGHGR